MGGGLLAFVGIFLLVGGGVTAFNVIVFAGGVVALLVGAVRLTQRA